MEELEITDVKTNADVHKILAQKCIFSGYSVTLATLIFGIATLPYIFTRINIPIHIQKEYKVFVGIFISLGASYYSGIYAKNRCQRSILNQLKERNLGHLIKGIE